MARKLPVIGWSARSTASPPSRRLASSASARSARSVRKPTAVTDVTASTRAASRMRTSPAARSRRIWRQASRSTLTGRQQPAGCQAQDAPAARRQALVVGHQHQGGAVLRIEFEQQVDDGATGLGVQVAGGLVGEQQRRPGDEGARQRDALLLAAGQLARIVLEALAKADPAQDRSRACLRRRGRRAAPAAA